MAAAFNQAIPRAHHDRLAALLRQARVEAGVAQQELAERLGVGVSVLSKMERGHRAVGALELRAVCAAIGLPLAEFMERLDRALAEGT